MTVGLSLLVNTSIRIAGISLAAWVVSLALRRSSAAARHIVWAGAIAAALLAPGLLQLPTRPVVVPATVAPVARSGAPASALLPIVLPDTAPSVLPTSAPVDNAAIHDRSESRQLPVMLIVLAAWAGVAGLGLLWVWNGLAATWRLQRTATRSHEDWMDAGRALATAMGIDRVTFLESAAASTPFTCGVMQPVVVLPSEASTWTDERLRAVLLHELAHVRRHDCLIQLVARVACAIYWFHPGVWFAAHRLRIERERACDDVVLMAGIQAPAYGQHLVDIARAALLMPSRVTTGGVAMAHRGRLEERLTSILDPRVPRRSTLTARVTVAAFGMLALAGAAVHLEANGEAPSLQPTIDVTLRADTADTAVQRNRTEPDLAVGAAPPPTERAAAMSAASAVMPPATDAAEPVQEPAALPAQPVTFDAVSIKRHVGDPFGGSLGGPPGQFRATNARIVQFIGAAWEMPMGLAYGIKGAPSWMTQDGYDVSIVWPANTPREQVQQMWRAMFTERFKLQVHYEEIDDPSYALTVARTDGKLGPDLKQSSVDCDAVGAKRRAGEDVPALPIGVGPCSIQVSGDSIIAGAITMGDLAPQLTGASGRQVVDRTGLQGRWEFSVRYSKEERDPNAPPGLYPSIFSVLQDRLGLKLVPFVGKNKLLVIDHIERPSEN